MRKNGTLEAPSLLPIGIESEQGRLREVTVREMTGEDEEALSRNELKSRPAVVMTELIFRCVAAVKGLSTITQEVIRKMTMADRTQLLIDIRRVTYGDKIDVELRCRNEACKHSWVETEDLSKLPSRSEENPETEYPFELPRPHKVGNVEVKEGILRIPDGISQEAVFARLQKNAGEAKTELLQRCIVSLDGLEKVPEDFVRSLSSANRKHLGAELDKYDFGPQLMLKHICPMCSTEMTQLLNVADFFG